MNSTRDEVPMNLFHAAAEREKEEASKHHIEMIKEGQINIFEVGQQEGKTDMQEQALAKLNDEMAANRQNSYVQAVGAFLVSLVESDPSAAEKVMVDGKTIAGSLADMQKEAGKKKHGNMAVLAPQEGFAIVSKHFGIELSAEAVLGMMMRQIAPSTAVAPAPAPVQAESEQTATVTPAPAKKRFDVSLDDLL